MCILDLLRIYSNAFAPLLFRADGQSIVTDTIYPARFKHVEELMRMNGNIKESDGTAAVQKSKLSGGEVAASDLRAGACLVIAGLYADGVTTVYNVRHIDRGYSGIVEKLKKLGADIWRESIED